MVTRKCLDLYFVLILPILFILTVRQRNPFIKCKFFVLNFVHFSVILNSIISISFLKTHFTIKNNTTFSVNLPRLIFTEISFCFAMRGVGHLTSNCVTQKHVVFILSQG